MTSDAPSASGPSSVKPAWLIELGWGETYELIEVIGRGGMGQVWKARVVGSQEVVALKILDPSRVGDEHLLARLEKEALTLQALLAAGRHQHIVAVLDFNSNETHACMVMAFIPGLDLRSWCETYRLDLRARVAFIEKVARAAGWCHQNGVVHRDLKPANILVHAVNREPVIVDFSIAKSLGQLPITLTGEALGTAPYMAPEQLDATWGEVTPASDVYAMGATLYELLTHVHPHPGGLAQITERHRNEVRPARPSLLDPKVPKDLDSICLKALANRPGERYKDGAQFADDLASFLAGTPVMARPASTLGYLARQARKRPYFSASVAGCVVLGIWLLVGQWQAQRTREIDELKQVIEAAIPGRGWPVETLESVGRAAAKLDTLDPLVARAERERWKMDVVADADAVIQRARMEESERAWVPAAIRWLGGVDTAVAERLRRQFSDRLERWEPIAEVRPPFTDLYNLFPKHDVLKDGDALLPNPSVKPMGPTPIIMVKQPMVSPPCEVEINVRPTGNEALAMALAFEFNQVRTRVVLACVSRLSEKVRKSIDLAGSSGDPLVMYIERGGKPVQSMVIPDATLGHRNFFLRVRVEPDNVRCELEKRWSLRMEEPFIIAQAAEGNSFQFYWPAQLRLNSLIIRNHAEKRQNSPLETGDVFAAQGRWSEARRQFEAHAGDEIVGQEATWKAAFAAYQLTQEKEALDAWKAMCSRPASPWRDLALYELWKHHALHVGLAQAAPFFELMPSGKTMDPVFHAHVTAADRKLLAACYEKAGMRVNVLHPGTVGTNQALKVFEVLEMPEVSTGRHLAMARHLCGLDEAARELWINGLDEAARHQGASMLVDSEEAAAGDCLDDWCRVDASENERRLGEWITRWRQLGGGGLSLQAVAGMEEARVKARAGKPESAMRQVQSLIQRGGMPPWQLARARLLEGLMQREQGREEVAQATWRKGIAAVAGLREPPGIMNLCDLFALHLVTGVWDHESAAELAMALVEMSGGPVQFQGGLASTLLADPAFVSSLASLGNDAGCRDLLKDYVLVKEPARQGLKRAAALVLEHYFMSTGLSPDPAIGNAGRVGTTVQGLITAAGTNAFDGEDFISFLQAWTSPAMSSTLLPASRPAPPDPLRAQLRWLAGERYASRGLDSASRPLLQAAQEEPSLSAEWKQRIETLLKTEAKSTSSAEK